MEDGMAAISFSGLYSIIREGVWDKKKGIESMKFKYSLGPTGQWLTHRLPDFKLGAKCHDLIPDNLMYTSYNQI